MALKKSLGEKLSILAKTQGKSQADIADHIGMAPSQLNRFFKGHSDLSSHNLMSVLLELGVDLDEMISRKTRKFADIDEAKVETASDCIQFLFKSLDDLGKQTYLSNLAWASKVYTKQRLPNKVEEILKREINLI